MAKIPVLDLETSSDRKEREMAKIPVLGLGTSSDPPAEPEMAKAAIVEAIRVGYRHFDTAAAYGSESHVGAAVSEALSLGLIASRDELFITTKLWAGCAEPHLVLPSLKASLSNLGMEYVDMYLIHWPIKLGKGVTSFPVEKENVQPLDIKPLWESMEECHKLGLAKAIGVSNFSIRMLNELLSTAKIPPAVNQVEMSVGWQQKKLREYCEAKGIVITAYSPTGASGTKWGDYSIIGSEIIQQIAQAKGKTPAQIALRWVYEQGVSLVVKSYNKERMRQNLDIFDWCLTEEELHKISQFPQRKLVTFAAVVGPHDLVLRIDSEL